MFSIRFNAGLPQAQPRSAQLNENRPRAISGQTPGVSGPAGSATPAPAAAAGSASGMPLWCVPAYALCVAMPIYGNIQTNKRVAEGRAKAAARLAAAAKK